MKRTNSFLKAFFFGLVLSAGFVFGLCQPTFAQQTDPNRARGVDVFPAPRVGEKITRPIAFTDATSPGYELQLEKDEYLEIEVEQFNVGLGIAIVNHDGVEMEHFISPNGKFGFLRVVFIAPAQDTYLIRIGVRGPEYIDKPDSGSFSLTILTKHPATPHDRAVRLAWEARRIATDAPDTRPGIPIALKALAMFREQGDQPGEAEVLFQLGRLYFYADEPETGIRYLNESLAILEKAPDENLHLRALIVLGEAHTQTGEYQTALEIMKRILAFDAKRLSKQNRAVTLRNLGFLYEYLLDDRSALECFEKALPLFRETGAVVYTNTVRSHQAGAFLRSGQPLKALEILNVTLESLTIDSLDGAAITQTLLNIGRVHRQMNNREEAIRFAGLALEQSRRRGLAAPEAETLHLQGRLAADAGETAAAAELFRKSLAISRTLPSRIQEIEDLTELARAEHGLGHLDAALTLITKAVDLTESIRGSLGDDELRTNYLGSVQARYEFFAYLLMELNRARPNEGFDTRALLVSERAKARTLIDFLRTRRITGPGKADQALIVQRQKIQKRINEANQTLVGLTKSVTDAESRKTIENELTAAVAEYRDLTNQLNALNPRYLRLTEPVALDVKDIRAQLDADSVLLEYALGTDKSFLWVVTKTGLKSHELPNRARIEQLARRTYDSLSARVRFVKYESAKETAARIRKADTEYTTVSKELSQILLGPVAAELKGKRLLIVGDGALLYLPFAVLPLPDSGQPLVTRCEITQLPSISTLSVLRQDTAGRQPATKTVAVLADPVFDPADPRVKGRSVASPGTSTASETGPTVDVTRAVADIDGPDRNSALARLPFTRREAKAIGALVPEAKRRIGLDFAASRETVFSENLGEYRFIHFATHGFVNSIQPDLSGVVLSMVNEKGERQNGFLHAYEVFNLKLPVEMVVLSGCRTGLGKEIRGEGMVGLTRAFLYAGAERVLVSHWAVEDAATSTLMAHTYAGMLKRKLRPSAALRAAQLKMMASQKYAHPFYWGAFTLQGEPK